VTIEGGLIIVMAEIDGLVIEVDRIAAEGLTDDVRAVRACRAVCACQLCPGSNSGPKVTIVSAAKVRSGLGDRTGESAVDSDWPAGLRVAGSRDIRLNSGRTRSQRSTRCRPERGMWSDRSSRLSAKIRLTERRRAIEGRRTSTARNLWSTAAAHATRRWLSTADMDATATNSDTSTTAAAGMSNATTTAGTTAAAAASMATAATSGSTASK